MKKILNRGAALVLLLSTLVALVALSACGTTGSIEGFLTSENYTFKSGKLEVKKDDATLYFTNGSVSKYLYYDKEAKAYFYSEVGPKGQVSKIRIDSEKYIDYHEIMTSEVAVLSKLLTGFLQVSDKLVADENGAYSVQDYKIADANGVITCTKGKNVAEISDIGSTAVEIPEKVLTQKVATK